MEVDAVIAEAVKETAEMQKAAPEAAEVTETPQVETQEEAKTEEQAKEPELTMEQLEKRFRNRESKLNSKLADFKRRNRELEALVGQNKQPEQPRVEATNQSQEPKIDDFETWEDYNKALVKYEAKQIREAENKQTQETQEQQKQQAWKAEREVQIAQKALEVMKQIPDYTQMVEEYSDVLDSFDNTPIETAFLEAENPELAAYALMKEGKLESLAQMSPYKMAMEIAKAEARGAAYLKQPKPTTNAPAPITSARGNSVGSTSIEKLDGVSLLKAIRST